MAMRLVDRLLTKSGAGVRFTWIQRAGWLAKQYPSYFVKLPAAPQQVKIEARADFSNSSVGVVKTWDAYGETSRRPDDIRSAPILGRFYADLVKRRRPTTVVEFGAGFGVSGMYWIAALELANKGHLYSFEVNVDWARTAADNMAAIGERYTLTAEAFEDNADTLPSIDIAFIDAVHTSEWLLPQFDLVAQRCKPGSIILLDDIDFSENMRGCWAKLANDPRVAASAAVADHLGVVELR